MDDSTTRKAGMSIFSDPDVTRIGQPRTEGAKPAVELPLRLLLVSELSPQASVDWSDASHVARIDKHGFDALLQQLAPSLTLEVPNKITDAPKVLDVELSFTRLEDFHPERVAKQVPALAQLVQTRRLVSELKSGDLDHGSFRDQIRELDVDQEWGDQLVRLLSAPTGQSAPPSSPSKYPKEGDAVDRLLNMVDLGGDHPDAKGAPPQGAEGPGQESPGGSGRATSGGSGQATPGGSGQTAADGDRSTPTGRRGPATPGGRGFVGALLQAVTDSPAAASRVEKPVADVFLSDIDEIIGSQLNEVMDHPSFRRLEAAWRGLKLLVDRIDFRKNIQLDVLPTGKDELSEALYFQVLLPEHSENPERPPLSAVILDFAFGKERAEVALLEDLAETGASLQVPIIASADASFFGVAEPVGLKRLPSLRQHLEGPEYIAWNKLRQKEDSRHLALVVPPFLLRQSYGVERPLQTFDFEERGHLWGGGALAVVLVVADSFARTTWPTHVRGNGENRIEGLPLWKTSGERIPLAAALPERKQAELADAGFVVLGCRVNRDSAFIAYAPTIRHGGSYDSSETADEVRGHLSLPSQLFVARAAHFLLVYQREVAPGSDIEQVRSELSSRLTTFLNASGPNTPADAVLVEHVPQDQYPDHEVLEVRLRPPKGVLNEAVSLSMHLVVPKKTG